MNKSLYDEIKMKSEILEILISANCENDINKKISKTQQIFSESGMCRLLNFALFREIKNLQEEIIQLKLIKN